MFDDFVCMLSCSDYANDFFDDFDKWLQEDLQKRNCLRLLARKANTSDSFSASENQEEIENAIDEIVANPFINFDGKFIKVWKKDGNS